MSIVEKVVSTAGGQMSLARLMSEAGEPVTYQAIQKWIKIGQVPAKRVVQVESALAGLPGALTRYQIRPDLAAIFATGSNCEHCED